MRRWWYSVTVLACGMGLAGASADASSGAAAWRAFFGRVIPAAAVNFASLRGAYDAAQGEYALKVPFDPKLVQDCRIFSTGVADTLAWQVRCDLAGYPGQAAGPATPDGPLTRDLTAALPHFKRGANMMGEPQWKNGHGVAVTIVFGGILVTHGYSDT